MVSSTGTALLTRSDRPMPDCTNRSASAARPSFERLPDSRLFGDRLSVDTMAVGGGAQAPARTAAGVRAMRRRRARLAADRRPPSGVLPSGTRRSAVVTADCGDEVADRSYPVPRWMRLACTLCFAATAVLVAVVLLSSGGSQVVGPVVVQQGDTLWSVAQRADPGADTRDVVARIKQLNGLQGDAVGAGVVLQVPVATP
jgi:LysM repeat protein